MVDGGGCADGGGGGGWGTGNWWMDGREEDFLAG